MRCASLAIVGWLAACGGKTDDVRPTSGGTAGSVNDYRPPINDGCFGKGTRIATATGSIAIEDVRVGDRVQAFDVATGMVVEKSVTEVFVHPNRQVGVLRTAAGVLRVTPNHPIYDAASQTFVAAGELTESFAALELASSWSTASSLGGYTSLAGVETVYNLTVAEVHTYFAEGLLVHNKPRCGYPGDPPDCPCSHGEPGCRGPMLPIAGSGGMSAGGMSGAGGLFGAAGASEETSAGGAVALDGDAGAAGAGVAGEGGHSAD